ncbi:hypothetical protein PHMEG_0001818 [Phytophthora megakarya]|uniref:Uncharacterized protein n=1 Tax=Phytophthora megakarya TaxID=4795 RepID=A0A225X286_9STRA|nr:hypothetical protein PHMEG_0001818 [Phytophthora megakarya]
MTLPKLTVYFQGNFEAAHMSHSDFECLVITKCSHWELATSISWENLPKDKFAIFYETNTCRTGGKYFYISDVAKVNGTHTFKVPQAIHSFMIGANNDFARRPSRIITSCNTERASIHETEYLLSGTTTYASDEIEWKNETSSEPGGLSSNWSDDLPPQ